MEYTESTVFLSRVYYAHSVAMSSALPIRQRVWKQNSWMIRLLLRTLVWEVIDLIYLNSFIVFAFWCCTSVYVEKIPTVAGGTHEAKINADGSKIKTKKIKTTDSHLQDWLNTCSSSSKGGSSPSCTALMHRTPKLELQIFCMTWPSFTNSTTLKTGNHFSAIKWYCMRRGESMRRNDNLK